ncbi:MAG: toxin-activating lysine-acyltransferase [Pseudomonadota bacterium]
MDSVTDPAQPIVVSSSTDIGYIVYLMARSPAYRNWSTAQAADMLLPALLRQQVRVYCDHTGAPIGFAAWAFVSQAVEERIEAGNLRLAANEWACGNGLVVLHFAALYGRGRAVLSELRSVLLENHDSARFVHLRPDGTFGKMTIWNRLQRVGGLQRNLGRGEIKFRIWFGHRHLGVFETADQTLENALHNADERLCRLLDLNDDARVLDAGCGNGSTARCIADRFGCRVEAIDRSGGVISDAWTDYGRSLEGKPRLINFRHADFNKLPYDDGAFDAVIASEILSLAEAPDRAVAEVIRVLKPGGVLLFADLVAEGAPDNAERLKKASSVKTLRGQAEWRSIFTSVGCQVEHAEDWTNHLIRTYQKLLKRLDLEFPEELAARSIGRELRICNEAAAGGVLGKIVLRLKKSHIPGRLSAPTAEDAVAAQKVTLIMLSGGIDSVYTLWKVLQETDDKVLVHHINLVNPERRHVVEAERCRAIVQYLQETVRPFAYSESTIDHRQFEFFGFDMITVAFEAGLVAVSHLLKNDEKVDRWMVGSCSEEPVWSERSSRTSAACEANTFPHPPPEYDWLPIVSKQEEINALPDELVAMTWGCRRPQLTDAGYVPCGTCATCQIIAGTVKGERAVA